MLRRRVPIHVKTAQNSHAAGRASPECLPTMQSLMQNMENASPEQRTGSSAHGSPLKSSLVLQPRLHHVFLRRAFCFVAEVLERLEEMQLKDTLRMFNGLVERCFSECVTGFRSKSLTGPEEKCVTVCANKYLKHSVSARHLRKCTLAAR
jgi:hypothetical protein